jgi:hypothetical protein
LSFCVPGTVAVYELAVFLSQSLKFQDNIALELKKERDLLNEEAHCNKQHTKALLHLL